jgi:hypothetical protein
MDKFKVGQELIHISSKRKVKVLRDYGGLTVYISYVGTGKELSVPRASLQLIEDTSPTGENMEENTLKNEVNGSAPLKVKKQKEKIKTNLDRFIDDVSMELDTHNYSNFCLKMFNTHNTLEGKRWGLVKMQLLNRLKSDIKLGRYSCEKVWSVINGE